jgi:hypothetical protein
LNVEFDLDPDVRQGSQMLREHDSNHTSTMRAEDSVFTRRV